MKVNCLKYSALLLAIIFSNCGKEKITLQTEEINASTSDDLRAIQFTDAQNGCIIGGKTWERGISLITRDGGKTWQKDSLQGWSLYGLGMDTEGGILTSGITSEVFKKGVKDAKFQVLKEKQWAWDRDIAARKPSEGYIRVGGQAWQDGYITRVFGDGSVQRDSFKQEIESVCFSDDSTVHAVGYGVILRSTNGGRTWKTNGTAGDFFQSVCFPSAKVGFTVGLNGTIAKTIDGGVTWIILRNGGAYTVSDEPFRSVFFTDLLRGYIVGDGGLVWQTSDGGDNWKVVKDLPNTDFFDVFVLGNTGWIVGAGGKLIRFLVN